MALPSSGQISISQIMSELGNSSGSLRTLSAAAGKSTPDAMSEFYGYSNRSITFSNLYSLSYSGYISGTVTITGGSVAFTANALLYGSGRVTTNITVNGNNRAALRTSAGTTTSTSFTLGPGTYSYVLDVTFTSGSGQGYIGTSWV